MFSLTVTLYEFRQFLQILMWIAIPLTIITITITVIMHYWRKKRKTEAAVLFPDTNSFVLPKADELPAEDEPVYQGVLWLRNKYQQDIALADGKIEQLKEEYGKLEKKYLELADKDHEGGVIPGETSDQEMQKKLQEYEYKIEQLERAVADKDQQLVATVQEKESLKGGIIGQAALQDMLDEKTTHINFLQNQLDQRIKIFHEVEYRGREDSNRVKELQERIEAMTNENQRQQEDIYSKTSYIENLENDRHVMQIQHAETEHLLNEKLRQEIQKTKELDAKLAISHRLLQKIHQEIDLSFERQMDIPGQERIQPGEKEDKPKISAWIESPSEAEEFEYVI